MKNVKPATSPAKNKNNLKVNLSKTINSMKRKLSAQNVPGIKPKRIQNGVKHVKNLILGAKCKNV
jgi:septation ring formation regulator EzrA